MELSESSWRTLHDVVDAVLSTAKEPIAIARSSGAHTVPGSDDEEFGGGRRLQRVGEYAQGRK